MFKKERKVVDWIIKFAPYFMIGLATIVALVIRFDSRKFFSGDSSDFLIPWFLQIRNNGGLASLREQIGDYNILYQTIIAFMTYLPGIGDDQCKIMYCYKALSAVFDFTLAGAVAYTVCDFKNKKMFGNTFALAYSIVLFLPTVVMNSSQWAQCDSIYSTFAVLFIYFFYREKYVRAFVFYGIALAFKFQTIFLLPFVLAYYFYKRRFSILYFLISAGVFWFSGIFAFFNGRPLYTPFTLYFNQTNSYGEMFMNFPSIWALFGNDYLRYKNFGILLGLSLCLIGFYLIVSGKKKIEEPSQYLSCGIWFVWSCLLTLPAMHERYAYLMDILLVMAAFLDKKFFKYAFIALIESFKSYPGFLIFQNHLENLDSFIYAAAFIHFTYTIFVKKEGEAEESVKTEEISQKNA